MYMYIYIEEDKKYMYMQAAVLIWPHYIRGYLVWLQYQFLLSQKMKVWPNDATTQD